MTMSETAKWVEHILGHPPKNEAAMNTHEHDTPDEQAHWEDKFEGLSDALTVTINKLKEYEQRERELVEAAYREGHSDGVRACSAQHQTPTDVVDLDWFESRCRSGLHKEQIAKQ